MEVIERADRVIAFCSRYGRMDVRDWPKGEVAGYANAITKLLKSESDVTTED